MRFHDILSNISIKLAQTIYYSRPKDMQWKMHCTVLSVSHFLHDKKHKLYLYAFALTQGVDYSLYIICFHFILYSTIETSLILLTIIVFHIILFINLWPSEQKSYETGLPGEKSIFKHSSPICHTVVWGRSMNKSAIHFRADFRWSNMTSESGST